MVESKHEEGPLHDSTSRLSRDFFNQNCVQLAKKLLGKVLARRYFDPEKNVCRVVRGTIVETESYLGNEDKASHSYLSKRTPRNEPMFMEPGTAYVYPIYGMYHCFNISSQGEGAAVLLRAIEPLDGMDFMKNFRGARRQKGGNDLKLTQLCNGPSKLCQSFCINKSEINYKLDLSVDENIWIEMGSDIRERDIISCKRIGIDRVGEEWAASPLRFYIKDNKFVSVILKDKK